jgi:hypothetical protein
VSVAAGPGSGSEHRPSPLSLGVVRAVALLMPGADQRDRYRLEFSAELYGMDRRHQAVHTLQVLSTAPALRHALRTSVHDRVAKEIAMSTTHVTAKPLLCRLNLRHRWVTRSTEDGSRFRTCARCGKDDSRRNGPLDGMAGISAS